MWGWVVAGVLLVIVIWQHVVIRKYANVVTKTGAMINDKETLRNMLEIMEMRDQHFPPDEERY